MQVAKDTVRLLESKGRATSYIKVSLRRTHTLSFFFLSKCAETAASCGNASTKLCVCDLSLWR